MRRSLIIVITAMSAFILASCGNRDAKGHLLNVHDGKSPIVVEQFAGRVPAADGPGIDYALTLIHNDQAKKGVYHLRQNYIDAANNTDKAFDSYGNYHILRSEGSNDRIVRLNPFEESAEVVNFLREGENKLTLLDQNMRRINSEHNYTLVKIVSEQ